MERARATWTDERLDDLSARIEDGFNRVDDDLRALRTDLGGRIDAVEDKLTVRIDAVEDRLTVRIDAVEVRLAARIDALQRIMIQFGGGLTLAVLATLVSVLATRA